MPLSMARNAAREQGAFRRVDGVASSEGVRAGLEAEGAADTSKGAFQALIRRRARFADLGRRRRHIFADADADADTDTDADRSLSLAF